MEKRKPDCSWSGRLCIKGLFPCVTHVEVQNGVQALSNWGHCLNIRWRAKATEAKDKYLKGLAEISAGKEVCHNGWFVNFVSMKPQRCPTNFEKLRMYLQKNSYVAALKQGGEVLMMTDRGTLSKMFMRSWVSPTEDQLCCILLSPVSKLNTKEPVCNTKFDWIHSDAAGSDTDFRVTAPLSSMLQYTSIRRAFQSQQDPSSSDASVSKPSDCVLSVKSVKSESSRSRFDAFIKEQLYSGGTGNSDDRKQRKRLYSSSSSDSERVPFSDRLRAINMQLLDPVEGELSVKPSTNVHDEESSNKSRSLKSASKHYEEGSTVCEQSNTENSLEQCRQKARQDKTEGGFSKPKKRKEDISERKEKKQDKHEKVKTKTKRKDSPVQKSGKSGSSLIGSKENTPTIPSTPTSFESTPNIPSSVGSPSDSEMPVESHKEEEDGVRLTNIFEAFKVTPPVHRKSHKTTSSTHSSKHSDKNSQSSSCHSVKMSLNAVVANADPVKVKKHKRDERERHEDKSKSRKSHNDDVNRADQNSPTSKMRKKKHKRHHTSRDSSPSRESSVTVDNSPNIAGETVAKSRPMTDERMMSPRQSQSAPDQLRSPRAHDVVHYCKICNRRCSGLQSYKKHLIKCKLTKQTMTTEFVCELCKVPCTSAESYAEHVQGSKHQKNLCGRCELCNVRCKNNETYAQHIWSSKHQKALKEQKKSGKPAPDSSSTATVKTVMKGPLQTFVGGSRLKSASDGNLKEVKTQVDIHSSKQDKVFSGMEMGISKHQVKQLGRIPKKKKPEPSTPETLSACSSVTTATPDSTTNYPTKKPVIDRTSPIFATIMKDLKKSDKTAVKDKKSKESEHHKKSHKSHKSSRDKSEKEKSRKRDDSSSSRKSKTTTVSTADSSNTPMSSSSNVPTCSSTLNPVSSTSSSTVYSKPDKDPVCSSSSSTVNTKPVRDPVCSTHSSTVNSKPAGRNTPVNAPNQNIFKSPPNLSTSLSNMVQKICSPVEVKLVRLDVDKNLKSKDSTARKKINISETKTDQLKSVHKDSRIKTAQHKGKVPTETLTSRKPEESDDESFDIPADVDTDDEDIPGLGPPMSERGHDLFDMINNITDSDTVQKMIAGAASDVSKSKASHNNWLSTVMSSNGKSSGIPGLGDLEVVEKQVCKVQTRRGIKRMVVKTSTGLKVCASGVKLQGSKNSKTMGLEESVKSSIHSKGPCSHMSESKQQVSRVVGFVLHQRNATTLTATTDRPGRNVIPLSQWASQKYDGYLVEIFQTVPPKKKKLSPTIAATTQVDKVTSELLNIINTRAVNPQSSTTDITGLEDEHETKLEPNVPNATVTTRATAEQSKDPAYHARIGEDDIVKKTVEDVEDEKKASEWVEKFVGKENEKTEKGRRRERNCRARIDDEDKVTNPTEEIKDEKKASAEWFEKFVGKETVKTEKRRSREGKDSVSTSSQSPTAFQERKRHASEPSRDDLQPIRESSLTKLRDRRSGSSDKQKDSRSGSTDKGSRTSSPLVFSSGQFADQSSQSSRSRTPTPGQSESIGKRLENLAARAVAPSESSKTEKRQARQYHPYRKEKESRSTSKKTPLWSFDIAYRDMDELLQNLTENQFLEQGHAQAFATSDMDELLQNLTENPFLEQGQQPGDISQFRKAAGRRTNWKSASGARGRFSGFRFTRASIPRHLPTMHSSDEEEPEEAVNPDAIPDLEERGRRADMVEEIFMGEASEDDEDTKNFVNETCIYNTEKTEEVPERTVTMSSKQKKLSSTVVIPEGNTTATYTGGPIDTTDETSSELSRDFGSRHTDCSQDTDDDSIPDNRKILATQQEKSHQEETNKTIEKPVCAKTRSKHDINTEIWVSIGEDTDNDEPDDKSIKEEFSTDETIELTSQSETDCNPPVATDTQGDQHTNRDKVNKDSTMQRKSSLYKEESKITTADAGRRENVEKTLVTDSSPHGDSRKVSASDVEDSNNDQASNFHASRRQTDCDKDTKRTSQLELETDNTSKCMKDGQTKQISQTENVKPELQSTKRIRTRTESSNLSERESEKRSIFSSESDITLDWTDEETALDQDSSLSDSTKTQDAVSYMMEACGEGNFIVVDACGETDTDSSVRQCHSEEENTISEDDTPLKSTKQEIDALDSTLVEQVTDDDAVSETSEKVTDALVSTTNEQIADDTVSETPKQATDAQVSTPAEQITDTVSKTYKQAHDAPISTPAEQITDDVVSKTAEQTTDSLLPSTNLSLSDKLSDSDKTVETTENNSLENSEAESTETPVDDNNNVVDTTDAVAVSAECSKPPRKGEVPTKEDKSGDGCYVITGGLDVEDESIGSDLPVKVAQSKPELQASVTKRDLVREKKEELYAKGKDCSQPSGGTYEIYCEAVGEKESNDVDSAEEESIQSELLVPTETLTYVIGTDPMPMSESQSEAGHDHTLGRMDPSQTLGDCAVAESDSTKAALSSTESPCTNTIQVVCGMTAVTCPSSSCDSSSPEPPSKPVFTTTSSSTSPTSQPALSVSSTHQSASHLQSVTTSVSQVSKTLNSNSTSSGNPISVLVGKQRKSSQQVETVSAIPLPNQPVGPSKSQCSHDVNVPKSESVSAVPQPNQAQPSSSSPQSSHHINVPKSGEPVSSVSWVPRTTISPSTSHESVNLASPVQGLCNRASVASGRSPYLRPVSPVWSNLVQQFVNPTASYSPNSLPIGPFAQPFPLPRTPPGVNPAQFLSPPTSHQAWQPPSPRHRTLLSNPPMQQSQYGVAAHRFGPPRFPQLSPYQNSTMPHAWNQHPHDVSPNSQLYDRASPYHLSQQQSFYEQGQWQSGPHHGPFTSPPPGPRFHPNSVLNSRTSPADNPSQSTHSTFYSSYYAMLSVQNVLPVYLPEILGSPPPPPPAIPQTSVTDLTETAEDSPKETCIEQEPESSSLQPSIAETPMRAALVDRPRASGEHIGCISSSAPEADKRGSVQQTTENIVTASGTETPEPHNHALGTVGCKEVCVEVISERISTKKDKTCKESSKSFYPLKESKTSAVEKEVESEVHIPSAKLENVEQSSKCNVNNNNRSFTTELADFYKEISESEAENETHEEKQVPEQKPTENEIEKEVESDIQIPSAKLEKVEHSSKCSVNENNRSFTKELAEFYKEVSEVENETHDEEQAAEASGNESEKKSSVTKEVTNLNKHTTEFKERQNLAVSEVNNAKDHSKDKESVQIKFATYNGQECKLANEATCDKPEKPQTEKMSNTSDHHDDEAKDKEPSNCSKPVAYKTDANSLALICSVYHNEDSSSCDSTAKVTQSINTTTSFKGVFNKELEKESETAKNEQAEVGTTCVVASVESIFQNCKWSSNVDPPDSNRSDSPPAETVEVAEDLTETISKDELLSAKSCLTPTGVKHGLELRHQDDVESADEPSLHDSASEEGTDRPLLSCFIKDSSNSSVQTSCKAKESDVASTESDQSRINRSLSNLLSRGIVRYQTDDRRSNSSTVVDNGKRPYTSSETTRSSDRSGSRTPARGELFSSPSSDCRYQYTKAWLNSSADLSSNQSHRRRHTSESEIKACTNTRSDEAGSDKSRSPVSNTRRHGGYVKKDQSDTRQSKGAYHHGQPSRQDRGRGRYSWRKDNIRPYNPRTDDKNRKPGSRSSSGSESRFYKSRNTARYRSRSKSSDSDRSGHESGTNNSSKYYPKHQGSRYTVGHRSGSNDSYSRKSRSFSRRSPIRGNRNLYSSRPKSTTVLKEDGNVVSCKRNTRSPSCDSEVTSRSRSDSATELREDGKVVSGKRSFGSPSCDSDHASRSSDSVADRGLYRARHSSGSSPYNYRADERRRHRFASGDTLSPHRSRNRSPSNDQRVSQKSSSQHSDMSNPYRRRHKSYCDDYSDRRSQSSYKDLHRNKYEGRPERSRSGDVSDKNSSDSEGTVVERRGRSRSRSSSGSSRLGRRSRSTDSSTSQSRRSSTSSDSHSDSDDSRGSSVVENRTGKSKLTRQTGAVFKHVSSTIQHRRYRSRRDGSVGDNDRSNKPTTDTFHADKRCVVLKETLSKDSKKSSTHNLETSAQNRTVSINKNKLQKVSSTSSVQSAFNNNTTENQTKLPTTEQTAHETSQKSSGCEQDRKSGTSSLSEGEVVSEAETGTTSEMTKEELAELERDQAVKKVFLQPSVLFNITPDGMRELLDGLRGCSSACCVWKLLLASSQMSQLALMFWDPKLQIIKSPEYSGVVEVADDGAFSKNEDLALHQIRCNANIRKIFIIRDEDEYDVHSNRLGLKKCTLADFTQNYLKPV